MPLDTVDLRKLAGEIKDRARELGFDLVGIAPAEPSRYAGYVAAWLAEGRAGSMDYLHDRVDERLVPASYLPGARSVVCVAMNYHTRLDPVPADKRPHHAKIARYALGDDYHELIKPLLHDLADFIRAAVPGTSTKSGVDTAPILERELAARAGAGWVGKNTCVLNERTGSWLLLGSIVTTLDLPPDTPATDHCGTCRRCLDACPTHAITGPYQLDASRCISYLTIEHRGEIAEEFHEPIGEWLYGCDICQDVCPYNRDAAVTLVPGLQPRFRTGGIDVRDVLHMGEDDYRVNMTKSAIKRIKLPQFQRNARIVQENLNKKNNHEVTKTKKQ
jgi:epoxyqueuosine reductase